MSRLGRACSYEDCDYWVVSAAALNLTKQAGTLGARHIKDGTLRLQFSREVAYYAKGIVDDVAEGRKSPGQGVEALKKEQASLLSQSLEIAQKGVGVVAGVFQFTGGAGICYASAGALCAVAGAPMMLHGANNIYENGRNLLEGRSDVEGPVRVGYQWTAKALGRGELEGNLAYGAMDLTMSAYALTRSVLKPGAWRLFRYIRTDYIRAYKLAGKSSLALEVLSNGITIKSMHVERNKVVE